MRASTIIPAMLAAVALAGSAPQDDSEPPVVAPAQEQITVAISRHADALLAASPVARPDDRVARDRAAEQLSRLERLIDAGEERVAWGVHDDSKAVESTDATLLHPVVMAKLYLSLFMFEGTPQITMKDGRTLLEIPAKFRDRLASGEYPEPFWITPEQWGSYTRTTAMVFVFDGEVLKGVMRKPGETPSASPARAWNRRWEWTDLRGRLQPRVAQPEYVFSAENPELSEITTASSNLNARLRGVGCLQCHAPDSPVRSGHVIRLHSPAAMLSVVDTLPVLLEKHDLPAGDPHVNRVGGIVDDSIRAELATLARAYEKVAEDALAYEAARRATAQDTEPVLPEATR